MSVCAGHWNPSTLMRMLIMANDGGDDDGDDDDDDDDDGGWNGKLHNRLPAFFQQTALPSTSLLMDYTAVGQLFTQ